MGKARMLQLNENNRCLRVTAAITCCLVLTGTAWADWPQQAKLTASDANAWDEFGSSVSISSNYAIVGAPLDNNDTGAAYIFKRHGKSWTEKVKLTASDANVFDLFGASVSIDRDFAIVGAPDDNNSTGSAYIFWRIGENWIELKKVVASDANAGDRFGFSVSINADVTPEDYAIVGAPYDNNDTGAAYIFSRSGPNWPQQAKLTASDANAGDNFGYSVSLSPDFAVAGAPDDNNFVGAAYVFEHNDANWTETAKLTASDGASADYFGSSVSVSREEYPQEYIIVGSPGDNNSTGSAYAFNRAGPNWPQQAKLTASDGSNSDMFGYAVSVSGNYAIIGALNSDDGGDDTGSAYIFRTDIGIQTWTQQVKLTIADSNEFDIFGKSVSISGGYAAVGTPGDDDKGSSAGAAYIFKRVRPAADSDGDSFVDFVDFARLARRWLEQD